MVLIHIIYAISLLTRTLRPVRFLVTKILGDDSHSLFFTDKRQEFLVLSSHIILDYPDPEGWSSWCRTRATYDAGHKIRINLKKKIKKNYKAQSPINKILKDKIEKKIQKKYKVLFKWIVLYEEVLF
jgi:hypothetical protein